MCSSLRFILGLSLELGLTLEIEFEFHFQLQFQVVLKSEVSDFEDVPIHC